MLGGTVARSESLLILDDVDADVDRLRELLAGPGRVVHHARTFREVVARLDETSPDLVFASLELPAQPGPRLVRQLKELRPSVHVVALTSAPDPAVAVATIRAGGADYLAKPIDRTRLDEALHRALAEIRTDRALRDTQDMVLDRFGFHDLLSRSPRMLEVFDQIRAVAPTNATVLVLGETGTGKELVARAIHDGSKRRDRPYISVNCGAFAGGLLESELFGHERGSFTGAVDRRDGVFSLADGGTLFLDELGQTSLGVQVNLLRVLESMSFRRVGGEKLVKVDVRIVGAANVDLLGEVAAGRFREDLYYRLDVFPIRLPPLRERREDIPLLLRHFLAHAAREHGLKAPKIAADAMPAILGYAWPGNVRQLRAMCERWVIVAAGRTVLREMLPEEMTRLGPASAEPQGLVIDDEQPLAGQLERVAQDVERAYLHKVLVRNHGHLVRTAKQAGISRRTLYNKLRLHRLDPSSYRQG